MQHADSSRVLRGQRVGDRPSAVRRLIVDDQHADSGVLHQTRQQDRKIGTLVIGGDHDESRLTHSRGLSNLREAICSDTKPMRNMDPHTGEILAMANEPTFNPNEYRDFADNDRRNRAVQDLYEPGSTFKVVTASAAIEEKVLPIDTLIDTNPGSIRIGPRVVTEASHHNYGLLSFGDVIVRSSNVGAIKIGFKVGTDRLSDYVQRFGFGRQVSPD